MLLDGWENSAIQNAPFDTGLAAASIHDRYLHEAMLSESALRRMDQSFFDEWVSEFGPHESERAKADASVVFNTREADFFDEPPIAESELNPETSASNGEVIVVIGRRQNDQIVWSNDGGDQLPVITPDGGEGGASTTTDESAVMVEINVPNPTLAQQAAIDAFLQAIERADKAIKNLRDDAKIRLYDGSIVTGRELKDLWAKTDFVINPDTVDYDNRPDVVQNRGAADYNGGDPIISQNIGNLVGYHAHQEAGMNYLVGHELGHLTAANRFHDGTVANANALYEQMAKDISRAIAHSAGLSVLPQTDDFEVDAYERYSTNNPLVFTIG